MKRVTFVQKKAGMAMLISSQVDFIVKNDTKNSQNSIIRVKIGKKKIKLNWYFINGNIQMENKLMKRCSITLVIIEMNVEIKMKYYKYLLEWLK